MADEEELVARQGFVCVAVVGVSQAGQENVRCQTSLQASKELVLLEPINNAREYHFLNILKILLPGQPDDMRLNTRAAMEETDDGRAGIVEPERTSTRKRVERGARTNCNVPGVTHRW